MSIYFTDTLGNYLFSFTGDALYHQGDESCLRRVVMTEEEKELFTKMNVASLMVTTKWHLYHV